MQKVILKTMSTFREMHLFAFLDQFDREPKPLDRAFCEYVRSHKSIGSHDRRFLGDTVYALIRWKDLLDHLYTRPASWEERYILWKSEDFDRLKNHAPLSLRCGSSEWLFHELSKDRGEESAAKVCQILNEPAPLTIRANALKISREELLASLQKNFAVTPCRRSKMGIQFNKRMAVTNTEEFKQGLFEIQDEGSQLVAELVHPSTKDHILDYCSGSGGKSLSIAAEMKGLGQIYLHDIRPQILRPAKVRFRRAGVQNAQFLPPEHPQLKRLKNKMDWVFVDVPCSGSGTYRRNPDMKWKGNQEMLDRLVQEQKNIFREALQYVRPGGRIVYATCSIFLCENEQQIAFFRSTFPLEVLEELRIDPESNGPDGFFGAVLTKIL